MASQTRRYRSGVFLADPNLVPPYVQAFDAGDSATYVDVLVDDTLGADLDNDMLMRGWTFVEADPVTPLPQPVAGSGPAILVADGTSVNTVNDNTEVTYGEVAVAAADIQVGDVLRFAMGGTYLANAGVSPIFRWRAKIGNGFGDLVTVYDASTGVHGASGNRCTWSVRGEVAVAAAAVQRLVGTYLDAEANPAQVTGWGSLVVQAFRYSNNFGSIDSVKDIALGLALRITMQLSDASPNISFRRDFFTIERLRTP